MKTVDILQLSQWLGVGKARLYQMANEGKLPRPDNGEWKTAELLPALCKLASRKKEAEASKNPKDRLVEAQANLAELKFRKAAKDVLDRHAVTLAVSGLAIELRRVLQGMDIDRETKERVSKQLATIDPAQVLARIDADLAEDEKPDAEDTGE